VLLTGQASPTDNGIFVANDTGAWVRSADAATNAQMQPGFVVFVTDGTEYAESGWILATDAPIALGTSPLNFTRFTGAAQLVAGAGLTKTANTVDVGAHADGSIAVSADAVQVGTLATDAQHGSRGGGAQHAQASPSVAGFISAADKTKLDGISSGAAALASSAPANVGTAAAVGVGTTAARSDHVHAHAAQTDGTLHAAATPSVAGFISAADKTKLDGVSSGAAALASTTPAAVAFTGAVGVGTTAARSDHVHAHGAQTDSTLHAVATPALDGFMSATDKTKLDTVATSAAALTATAPTQITVTTAAVGVATAAAKGDHVHSVSTGAPSALAVAGTQSTGSATSLARSDHQHAMPDVATASVSGFLSAADKTRLDGMATGAAALTSTLPVNVDNGTNAVGVGTTAARHDHKHTVTIGTPVALTVGGANAQGAATSLVRSDHTHGMPALVTASVDGFMAATDKSKLDGVEAGAQVTSFARVQTALGVASSPVSFNSQKITNVVDPTAAQEVATKAYVDAYVQGLDIKASCRLVATSNVATLSGSQTIDGSATSTGDRVLLTSQTTPSANGIYLTAAGAWSRATDADSSADVSSGMYTYISEGTANADSGWVLTTNDPITLGTTALAFTQFSGAGQITAGAGLTKTANTLDVGANGDGSIVVNADNIQIGVIATDAQHGVRAGGTTHAAVVAGGASGFMTGADKTRLDGMATSAAALTSTAPASVGTTAAVGVGTTAARSDHVHAHAAQTDGTLHAAVIAAGASGFMTGSDKSKLDGVEAGAQVTSFARVQTALGVASSAVGFNAQKLSSVADPTAAQDAATKAYVDAIAQGLDIKTSCRLVSTSNVATLSGSQTIDGSATSAGDRVLLTSQTTPSANGIYLTAAGAWLRAPDADTSAKVTSGMYTFITEGAANADSGWALITPDPIVLGTTALSFTQVSGAGQITAGAGLTKSGNTLDVIANADGSIVVAADAVGVGVLATDAQHGTRGGGTVHAAVVAAGASGFMTGADKTKLDSVATNAAAVLSVTPLQVDGSSGNGGAATTASRSDHRHQVTTGTPNALTMGASTAAGTSNNLVRADHIHALPAAGTPVALTLAGSNAAGSAATLALSDHVHALPASSTAPPALTVGGSSAAGSSTSLSKADHVHALPASSAPLENTGVATAGTSTSVARDDHRHPTAWKAICTALLESVGFNASAPPTTVDGVTIVAGNLILVDGTLAPLAADDSEPEPLAGELLGIFVSLGATWQFLETLDRGEVAYVLSRNTLYTYSGSQYVELYPEVNYSQHGLMSVFDYTKLVSIQANAAAVTSTAPTQITVTTAAAGSSGSAARGDHVHSVSTGSPVALGIGQTAGDGTSTALARADHSHATPSSGIPVSLTLAATNAAGVATTVSRSDHVHALPSSSVIPSALTMGTAGSAGSSLGISKADHTHPLPNAGTPTNLTLAGTNFAGSAATLAVSDHVHALPATAAPVALTPGGSNAAGSAVTLPRSDHVHALPAFGQTSGTFCDGADVRLTVIPSVNGFRLAPTVDDAIPTDGTFSTVYLAPITSDLIAIYTGTAWVLRQASGVSYVLSGRTTDIPFDVYAAWNGTAVVLEVLNWTSGTARATAITRVNGVWTKSGDATRRYLGTVRPRSATTYAIRRQPNWTVGTAAVDIWNVDNRKQTNVVIQSPGSDWTYSTATYRQANAQTNAQIDTLAGLAGDCASLVLLATVSSTGAGAGDKAGVAISGALSSSQTYLRVFATVNSTVGTVELTAFSQDQVPLGVGAFKWLEKGTGSGTNTWYGDTATENQSGLGGVIWC
jgi:hypothetical protein